MEGKGWFGVEKALQTLDGITSYNNLLRLCKSGHITARKVGRKWYINEGSLHSFVEKVFRGNVEFKDRMGKTILKVG